MGWVMPGAKQRMRLWETWGVRLCVDGLEGVGQGCVVSTALVQVPGVSVWRYVGAAG